MKRIYREKYIKRKTGEGAGTALERHLTFTCTLENIEIIGYKITRKV